MPINSRTKGASGEREAAKALKKIFPHLLLIRGQQRSGLEQADVVGLSDDIHIEVKRYKTFGIWKFIQQMRRDATVDKIPVLMLRPDGDTDWHVMLSLSHLLQFTDIIKELSDDKGTPPQSTA